MLLYHQKSSRLIMRFMLSLLMKLLFVSIIQIMRIECSYHPMSFSIRPGKTCYTLNQRKVTHDSIRLSSATIIYFIIIFPGSITRYHPYMFESILSDKDIWMIGEFLKTQPPQFMNMLLSKLLSTPIFGLRMPLQSEG